MSNTKRHLKTTQQTIDGLWGRTIIKLIPRQVQPNHLTLLRIFFIPVVLYFLVIGSYGWALVYFIVASLLDSLDGALARQRNQITPLGLILDPVSDKILIILVSAFLIFQYPLPWLFVFAIIFDLPLLVGGLMIISTMKSESKEVAPANWWGKIKMVCQVASILMVFLYLKNPTLWTLALSVILLVLSAIFGFVNMLSQGERVLEKKA